MSRPKGGKNRSWSKEDKIRIVKRYFNEHIGRHTLAKEENISSGMLWNWIQKYRLEGENALENKKKQVISSLLCIRASLYLSRSVSA
jgi:transposase-like protein